MEEKKNEFFPFLNLKKEKIRMSSPIENMKSPRIVEIFNSDGSVTTYPSINKAAKLLGLKKGTAGVYRHIARGEGS